MKVGESRRKEREGERERRERINTMVRLKSKCNAFLGQGVTFVTVYGYSTASLQL